MKKYIKASSSTKPTTFDELAKLVAAEYADDISEHNFETFDDIAYFYRWTSTDIKDEIREILDYSFQKWGAYIDEVDGSDVFLGDNSISYRAFSRMFRKYIQEMIMDNLNRK